jgi:hypothetical protein
MDVCASEFSCRSFAERRMRTSDLKTCGAFPDVAEILNLQPRGSLAKPYQVKQVRAVIVRYKLAEGVE